MKQTRLIMGMPITVNIISENLVESDVNAVFTHFHAIDKKFSTYKLDSEISKINRGKIRNKDFSRDVKVIFELSEKTRQETLGYFNIWHKGFYDPSGLVKGWAIYNASQLLLQRGYTDFYVEAGGDIQAFGRNNGEKWRVGIRSPFERKKIIKVLTVSSEGIATSGTYMRGSHIYNPHGSSRENACVSITVVGPNVYEADRFATAAFAMGLQGIRFIERLHGFEAYMIDRTGVATMTSNFERFILT